MVTTVILQVLNIIAVIILFFLAVAIALGVVVIAILLVKNYKAKQ